MKVTTITYLLLLWGVILKQFIHIVEHFPKRTIYHLIKPLTEFDNHTLLYAPEDIIEFNDLFKYDASNAFVIHSTGRMTEIFLHCLELAKKFTVYIFLHVSPDYMRFKERHDSLKLMQIYYQYGIKFLSPCNAIKRQLLNLSISSDVIQIGTPDVTVGNYPYLNPFYGKIITCCSENTCKYFYAKGINEFIDFIEKNHLQNKALIVGSDNLPGNIDSIYLPHNEFIHILSKALMYVQFSKFEAYNITAIEAKKLKIPVVVLDTEGISDNILYGFACTHKEEMCDVIINILKGNFEEKVLELNYKDSQKRETVKNFDESLRMLGC